MRCVGEHIDDPCLTQSVIELMAENGGIPSEGFGIARYINDTFWVMVFGKIMHGFADLHRSFTRGVN